LKLLNPDLFEQGELILQIESWIVARFDDFQDLEDEGRRALLLPIALQGRIVVLPDGQHEAMLVQGAVQIGAAA
jgi:hypothetical protein